MTSPEPYAPAVRSRFANPAHAGDLPPGYAVAAAAEAADGNGCRIRIVAAAGNGVVTALRFRCFGCPHLIAAAEAACETYEGRPAAALRAFETQALMEELAVPVEKTGRILLLEDALLALAGQLEKTEHGNESEGKLTNDRDGDYTD
ncbi:MAG TPA: iron-sulfur cluster assembly scaffold protein [Woeseiaceae bacterium]|nr:iron-sulfur cluster assembly scaffold protein [Woeseiaceae bacterium]